MASQPKGPAPNHLDRYHARLLEAGRETIRRSRELLEQTEHLVSLSPAGPLIRPVQTECENLAKVDQHIAEGQGRVTEQEICIAEMERRGKDTPEGPGDAPGPGEDPGAVALVPADR